jgi:5-methylcytosine-specific restriction endonuclease McrA
VIHLNLVGAKWCSKCNGRRYLSQFTFNKANRDGLQGMCNPCTGAYKKARRDAGIGVQREKERNAIWRAANKPRKAAQAREWFLENKERFYATARRYRRANLGKIQAREREKGKLPHRRAMIYTYTNARRARKKLAGGRFTVKQWIALKTQHSNICLRCRKPENHADKSTKLTADHVIPLSKGGRNDIGNIQPLCGFCNTSKGTKATDYRSSFVAPAIETP